MKLMHMADLHLGKRLYGFSLLEDQAYLLEQILAYVKDRQPDAVLIAGDVFDKSLPAAEAVSLFDDFLVRLSRCEANVFFIGGNHDSAERLAFGGRLMAQSRVYAAPVYSGDVSSVRLHDAHGAVDIYLLPFIRPANVRAYFPEEEIDSYTDALSTVIAHMPLDSTVRNVLVTHQFVTGAMRSDSESISIGGADNVDSAVFAPFCYTALGHLHTAQSLDHGRIRYAGAPMKYAFSEEKQQKSVTMATLNERGEADIDTLPLTPLREMRKIRGRFSDIMDGAGNERKERREDYVFALLTDEEEIPNAADKLRDAYPNLMLVDYDNTRSRTNQVIGAAEAVEKKTPGALFGELYEKQNNQCVGEEQARLLNKLILEIWEEQL